MTLSSHVTISLSAPLLINAYLKQGEALHKQGQFKQALVHYEKAIALNQNYALAHVGKGALLHELGHYAKAIESYDRAIGINPDFAEAYTNRGLALHELDRMEDALVSYDKAIEINPSHAQSHYNRGNALLKMENHEIAIESYLRAVKLDPQNANAFANLGVVFQNTGDFDKAYQNYLKAISIDAQQIVAQWNLAILNLLRGNFQEGWEIFEWHRKNFQLDLNPWERNFSSPLWLGKESLQGKTILLHAEQGLGDTIQFSRYASQVAALGAQVTLLVPTALKTLFSTLEGVFEVVDQVSNTRSFDYQCPLMSLPLAFKTDLDSIPPPPKNLRLVINPEQVQFFEKALGPKTKPRIGVCWSSVSNYAEDHKRSLSLEQFLQGLPKEGFDYICLQKEIKPVDQALLKANPQIQWFGDELNDFSDTAALIEQVDLVVSTCTSVPHLSASLGKPTWILLPFSPDWRWMLERTDSPWYPSVTLIRQTSLGDWDGVLNEIKGRLVDEFHAP